MEQVLVIIKPEGVKRGIVTDVLKDFLVPKVKMVALKMVKPTRILVQKHYIALKDKFFYQQIINHLTGKFHDGSPVVAFILQGKDIIKYARTIAGATNPKEASLNSVRGKYGRITKEGLFENIVHVSSSKEDATREIKLWFKKSEILTS